MLALERKALEEANEMLQGLFADLEARVTSEEAPDARREVNLDMRYVGQEHTLTIAVDADSGRITQEPESIRETFTRDYLRTFGLTMEEEAQIVSVRATTRAGLPRRRDIASWQARASDAAARSVSAYSFTRQEWLDFAVLDRFSLAPETVIDEPAIIPRGHEHDLSRRRLHRPRTPVGLSVHQRRRRSVVETVTYRAVGKSTGGSDADPITTEVIRHGLNSAAEQMKLALIRTAFSPVIYEILRLRHRHLRPRHTPARAGPEPAAVHGNG